MSKTATVLKAGQYEQFLTEHVDPLRFGRIAAQQGLAIDEFRKRLLEKQPEKMKELGRLVLGQIEADLSKKPTWDLDGRAAHFIEPGIRQAFSRYWVLTCDGRWVLLPED